MSIARNLPEAFTMVESGETVSVRPHGGSMRGLVESGQLVTVEPLGTRPATKGEIVLCKVRGNVYVHLVKGVRGAEYLIGNNLGGINGWTRRVFGRVVAVQD